MDNKNDKMETYGEGLTPIELHNSFNTKSRQVMWQMNILYTTCMVTKLGYLQNTYMTSQWSREKLINLYLHFLNTCGY